MPDPNLQFEKPVVIVTDDEPLLRTFLSALLEEMATVVEAESGEQVIDMIDETAPELILLDVEMPGMSGYETCEKLKSNPKTAGIPIIFITGREDVHDEEHGLVIGGVDYIKKPLSPGLVRARINNQLQLIRYQRELERLATTDQLTELWNRRHLLEIAGNELGRYRRYGHTFSVALFDIDHFKRLNDTYGHAAGDYALRECARLMSDAVRSQDTLARIGGEEFCVLLPDTDVDGARQMAEKMRQRVEDIEIAYDDAMISFTISIGVTEVHADDETFEAMLARADEALYNAKAGGRNRVELTP
ncbi:MAG: diguanylate cyclase [Rhodospirillales bacterium]